MNKVICDVCGTDYPETASQCPICGCATVGGQTSLGNLASGEEENGSYTPVKGGRFSKSNVRKRLKTSQVQESRIVEPQQDDMDDEDNDDEMEHEVHSNRGLIVIVILLLLAIIAVSVYIAISIFGVGSGDDTDPTQNPIVQTNPTTASTEQTEKHIPCSSLTLGDMEISLQSKDSTWDLKVTVKPVDTTDELLFASSDESVVKVDPITGRVIAVGEGEAKIIVRCGDATVECPVTCAFPTEPTDPTTENPDTTTPTDETDPTGENEPEGTTEPTEDPDGFVLELRRFDFTMTTEGETFRLYNGDVSAFEITWTSEDESVATIENGVVTAVGKGTTKVIAEYDGQKAVCIVRCNLPQEDTEEPTENTEATEPTETTEPVGTTEPEEPTTPTEETTEPDNDTPTYVLRKNGFKCTYGDDFTAHATISVGESFKLAIVNADNEAQDVNWSASKEGICTVKGTTVKGIASGKVKLSVNYEGKDYTCEIIVK